MNLLRGGVTKNMGKFKEYSIRLYSPPRVIQKFLNFINQIKLRPNLSMIFLSRIQSGIVKIEIRLTISNEGGGLSAIILGDGLLLPDGFTYCSETSWHFLNIKNENFAN